MTTIGERLEDARKKKGISIREAAEATKVRGDYLQKFESNLFDIGLTEIYTRGFLRSYAVYLKLPADRILNDYTALGRGDARPRQPNREVYGRMDLTISSPDERPERAAPPAESAAEPAHSKPHFPRSRNNLPEGPAIDPVLLSNVLKFGGGGLALLLVIWGAYAIFGGKSAAPAIDPTKQAVAPAVTAPAPAPVPVQAAPQPVQNRVVVTALDNVRVTAWAATPEGTYGAVILQPVLLNPGETASFPKNGKVYFQASAMENVTLDVGGQHIIPSAPPHNHRGFKGITLP